MRGRKHTNLLLCSHNFVESQPREQFRIAIYLCHCVCIRSRSSTACWGEYTAKGLILLILLIIINNLCYCNANRKRLKPEQHVAITLLEVCLVHAVTRAKNQSRRLSYHMSVDHPNHPIYCRASSPTAAFSCSQQGTIGEIILPAQNKQAFGVLDVTHSLAEARNKSWVMN